MYVSKKWIGKRAYPIFLYVGVSPLYTLYFILLFTLSTLLFTQELLPVLAWYATIILLETFVEIALIHEADLETNFSDRIFSFKDKFCGNTHFLVHKVLVRTYTQNLFHSSVELRVSHLHECSKTVNRKVMVADMLCDEIFKGFFEFLVERR